jgi:hypothetical protein
MTLLLWLGHKLRHNPEGLLSLLIEAHKIDTTRNSIRGVFRAGMRFALDYPEQAATILETPGYPGQTKE